MNFLVCIICATLILIVASFRQALGEEPAPYQFKSILRVIDLDRNGFIEESEWARFEIFRRKVKRRGIDTSQPLNVEELGSTIDMLRAREEAAPQKAVEIAKPVEIRPAAPIPRKKKSPLPEEYRDYDANGDGQIGLYEWPRSKLREFRTMDHNGDGLLEPREFTKKPAGTN